LRQGDSALVQIIASLTLNLILNGYSRSQEKEADQVGVLLATKASYSPVALTGFLQSLSNATGGDPSRIVQLFQTHPGAAERIANINSYIAKNNIKVTNPILNEIKFKNNIAVLPPKADLKTVNTKPQ
jgi:predicted Zn-dependent protease